MPLRNKPDRPIPAAAKAADAAADKWRDVGSDVQDWIGDIRANGITVKLFGRDVLNFAIGEKPKEETK